MLLLCRTLFKLQLTEGSLQVTKIDTPLMLSACRFTAKLQSTVKGRSMFVIIHKIIWLYRIGIMLRDLEMQPLMSKRKPGEAVCGSLAFPEPQPIRGAGWSMRTGLIKGISPSHSLTRLPQRTPKEKASILWESSAPSLIISKYRPQRQQQQSHALRNGGDISPYMERRAKQKIALWGSQMLHKKLNRVKMRMLVEKSMLLANVSHQSGSPAEPACWLSTHMP